VIVQIIIKIIYLNKVVRSKLCIFLNLIQKCFVVHHLAGIYINMNLNCINTNCKNYDETYLNNCKHSEQKRPLITNAICESCGRTIPREKHTGLCQLDNFILCVEKNYTIFDGEKLKKIINIVLKENDNGLLKLEE